VVNSLEPTEVTKNIPIPAQFSTPSAPPPPPPPLTSTKTKKIHKKRANKQGISLEARRSHSTRGKHREKEKLKKMIKQTISLVSMGNGEEYALPQVIIKFAFVCVCKNKYDYSVLYLAIFSSSQRVMSQKYTPCQLRCL